MGLIHIFALNKKDKNPNMSKFTQEENVSIDFKGILNKCFNQKETDSVNSIYKTLIVLSITTGLEIELIMGLRWKDLLMVGSDNDTEPKKDLDDSKVRKYLIPINKKVGVLLSQCHTNLDYPKLESKILDAKWVRHYFSPSAPEIFAKKVIIEFILNTKENSIIDEKLYNTIDIDNYTRKLFGRRVLEVNGYSNEVSKQLKNHFRFKTNKELFDFLGYSSGKEIEYDISRINFSNDPKIIRSDKIEEIIYCSEFIKLEDKNFHSGYHFQKFSAFSKFIISKYNNVQIQNTTINSIWLLLLISLYNGISISRLLDLKWKDILIEKYTEKGLEFEIVSSFKLDNYTIKILEVVKKNLSHHFKSRKTSVFTFGTNKYVQFYYDRESQPQLDSPVFITNTGKGLTQNSLSREIKTALNSWAFPHADKFTAKSTLIMWGRRIIEIRGDHKPTIKALKKHFNFKSQDELFKFLCINYNKEVKGKMRKNIFEEIFYDL
jgi:integrase